jgi:hypothetical protein
LTLSTHPAQRDQERSNGDVPQSCRGARQLRECQLATITHGTKEERQLFSKKGFVAAIYGEICCSAIAAVDSKAAEIPSALPAVRRVNQLRIPIPPPTTHGDQDFIVHAFLILVFPRLRVQKLD